MASRKRRRTRSGVLSVRFALYWAVPFFVRSGILKVDKEKPARSCIMATTMHYRLKSHYLARAYVEAQELRVSGKDADALAESFSRPGLNVTPRNLMEMGASRPRTVFLSEKSDWQLLLSSGSFDFHR